MRTDSKKIKFIAVIACVVLVVAAGVSATVAYIIDQQTMTLTYDLAKFDMEFVENTNFISYTSNVPVYFRFMISYNGNVNDIAVDDRNWTNVGDYYYYNDILLADSKGSFLKLPEIKISTESDVEYDIVAEICQIEPDAAVQDVWKVSYNNGMWTALSSSESPQGGVTDEEIY